MFNAIVMCPECHCTLIITYWEDFDNHQLLWKIKYSCDVCGTKSDGQGGFMGWVEPLREAEMFKHGKWELVLNSFGENLTLGLKAFRQVFDMSVADLSKLRQSLPEQVLTGTKAEINHIHDWLLSLHNEFDFDIQRIS